MRQYSRWLSALLLLLVAIPAWTQDHMPKLIDVHIHYDGEPGILEKLLDKLDSNREIPSPVRDGINAARAINPAIRIHASSTTTQTL